MRNLKDLLKKFSPIERKEKTIENKPLQEEVNWLWVEKQKHIEKIESLQGEAKIVYEPIAGKQDELQKEVQWEVTQAKENQTVELVDEICQKRMMFNRHLKQQRKSMHIFHPSWKRRKVRLEEARDEPWCEC